MKKLLLSLGSVAAIVAPVAAVVACGDDKASFTLSSELNTAKTVLTVTVKGKDVKIEDLTKEINAKADAATASVQFKVEAANADLVTIPATNIKDAAKVTDALKAIKYAGALGKVLVAADRNKLTDKPTTLSVTAKTTATIDATKATNTATALVEAKKLTIANFDVTSGATALTATEVKLVPVEAKDVDFTNRNVKFTIELITDANVKATVDVSFGTTSTTKFATDKDSLVASIKALPKTKFEFKDEETINNILDLVKDAEVVKTGVSVDGQKDIVLLKSSTIVAKLGTGFEVAHGPATKTADQTNAHPWKTPTTQQGVGQDQLQNASTIGSRYKDVTEADIKKADAILVAETNTSRETQISIIAVNKTNAAIYWENVFKVM